MICPISSREPSSVSIALAADVKIALALAWCLSPWLQPARTWLVVADGLTPASALAAAARRRP
ncbi:hypothetical protein [Nonomuraea sp. SYSU D8015]|uniref:hypothetical protein n=1 Tax=Nonomuraea sp. SYSU D8015 TaxID=2593644 RepID=UPI001660E5F4|nr:hypothetical protein [Nonomuraea sp. SYSU D8015]